MIDNEWGDAGHAGAYLAHGADWPPHRLEGEAVLVAELPAAVERVLDLGTGDGRLLASVLAARPGAAGVALDGSAAMLERAAARFAGNDRVAVAEQDLDRPLHVDGPFDAVVTAFAVHHCHHERKRALYAEVFDLLSPGGVFANLEHVSSPTPRLHQRFFDAIGVAAEDEDPSNRLLDLTTQLGWLAELGFEDVDCYWKWRELALMIGRRPS